MAELAKKMDQAVKAMTEREGKYLTFSMAKEEYGIGILKIKEIIGMLWTDYISLILISRKP